jgi:hypothetical protein
LGKTWQDGESKNYDCPSYNPKHPSSQVEQLYNLRILTIGEYFAFIPSGNTLTTKIFFFTLLPLIPTRTKTAFDPLEYSNVTRRNHQTTVIPCNCIKVVLTIIVKFGRECQSHRSIRLVDRPTIDECPLSSCPATRNWIASGHDSSGMVTQKVACQQSFQDSNRYGASIQTQESVEVKGSMAAAAATTTTGVTANLIL